MDIKPDRFLARTLRVNKIATPYYNGICFDSSSMKVVNSILFVDDIFPTIFFLRSSTNFK